MGRLAEKRIGEPVPPVDRAVDALCSAIVPGEHLAPGEPGCRARV